MDGKDGDTSGSLVLVYTPFTNQAFETKLRDSFVERLVPDAAGLFHAVETFNEPHYPILFATDFKTGRLFHIDGS